MTSAWWRLPPPPLRASLARALLTGTLGTIGLILIVQAALGTGYGYFALSLATFAIMAFLVAGRIRDHHPYDRFGPANAVTLARVCLLAGVGGLVEEPATTAVAWLAVGFTLCLVLLDGIDGWLARRAGVVSAFGARFDMETDALVILVLSLLVWRQDKAGVWVLGCGLMRYAFVAAGWLLPWLAAPLRSTLRGKSVAIAQLVGLAGALCPLTPARASHIVALVTLAALAWSFAVDIGWLWRTRINART